MGLTGLLLGGALLSTALADVPPTPMPEKLPELPAQFTPRNCGDVEATIAAPPPPALVSGRVSLYAAEYDPVTLRVLGSISYGPVTEIQPTASIFKSIVVEQVLRDVDAGLLSMNTPFKTTPENRSIEFFPPGTNSLQKLAQRAIELSDNTAADILLLAAGTERFARLVLARSPCTHILLTRLGRASWPARERAGARFTQRGAGVRQPARRGTPKDGGNIERPGYAHPQQRA